MKKVATFSRVSTLDQHTSIENQEKVFEQWFECNDNCILYKAYVDEGISGAKSYKRIQWNKMINDGMNKNFDILVCKSFSRFGRNQRETLEAINKLRIKGVRIIFLEDNLDSEKDMANFGLMAWLAEKEANATSERLKLIWASFNKQGKIHTAKPIYGYDYDKNKKQYTLNVAEAEVVKEIFRLYLEGYGYNKISQFLVEKETRTKCGGVWQANTIAKMLVNEFYVGTLVQGKTRTIDATVKEVRKIDENEWYRHINHHEAIIDVDIFKRVQFMVKERGSRAKESYAKDVKSTRNSNKSLFSNLLICGECGEKMYAKRRKSQGYKRFYNCLAYERLGTKCGHSSNRYNEHDLIQIVKMELLDIGENNNKKLRGLKVKVKSKSSEYNARIKSINSIIEKNISLANNLLVNYSNNLIAQELYAMQNEKINKSIKNLIVERSILEEKLKLEDKTQKDISSGIEEYLNTPIEDFTNAVLKEFIENITIKMDGSVNIKIKYKHLGPF